MCFKVDTEQELLPEGLQTVINSWLPRTGSARMDVLSSGFLFYLLIWSQRNKKGSEVSILKEKHDFGFVLTEKLHNVDTDLWRGFRKSSGFDSEPESVCYLEMNLMDDPL